jgi:putative ABC transport system permease protein
MLKNNLRISLRFLNKNKLFTAINTLGLSIALAASFIILLYVINELSYDHCHNKHKRIYRILVNHTYSKNPFSSTPYVLATSLKEEFPQIEKIAWFTYFYNNIKLKLNGEFIPIYPVIATDPDIFDIFTIPLIMGSSHENLLDDKNSIILSRKQAEKFFPGQNPVGKEIIGSINNEEYNFTVKAVFEDIPENSTLKANCFINIQWSIDEENKTPGITNADKNWNSCYGFTWILVSEDTKA